MTHRLRLYPLMLLLALLCVPLAIEQPYFAVGAVGLGALVRRRGL